MFNLIDPTFEKKILDNSVGLLNKGATYLLRESTIGNNNLFEVILYPHINSTKESKALTIAGNALLIIYIQAITFSQEEVEYEQMGRGEKGAKGIIQPTEITFKMLESDYSLSQMWIEQWQEEVYDKDNLKFRENQEGAKRNGLIIPKSRKHIPQPFIFKLEGLKFSKVGESNFDQTSTEPKMIDLTCTIDRVKALSGFTQGKKAIAAL